jgi:hypothetical protein
MLSFNESPEEETSLWDNPINDTSGVLSINGQDNLVLYGKKNQIHQSSLVHKCFGLISQQLYGSTFKFRKPCSDSIQQASVTWKSIDHPTNTMLLFATLGRLDRKTGQQVFNILEVPE